MHERRSPGRAEGSELLGHTSHSSSLCFASHPHPKPCTSLWLPANPRHQSCAGAPYNSFVIFIFFPYRNIRDKHNNFQGSKASRWRSQQGPAAESWYGVSVTLIPSDTWVSPKPSHCAPQMYINISMHWHNMDPLFQMLMRTRCCLGAAAAF